MEGASGAVEFLSVECDMIFAPDCDLETECHVDSQQEGEQEGRDGTASPSCNTPSPGPPTSHTLPTVNELFKGRNVGVYSRTDPEDPFVLIYDPTLQPPVAEGEGGRGGWSGPKENGEAGEGDEERWIRRQPARCSVCHKQFRSRGCLVTHSLTHIQPSPGPPPPCPVCSAALPSRAALMIHVRRHFSVQTYQCPGCHQRHLTRAQLVMHHQLHSTNKHHLSTTHSLAINPTRCQTQKRTHSPPGHQPKAQTPQEGNQTPESDLHCERCDATFTTRTALWAHRKCHRERRRRRRRHECPECGSQFWRSSALKKHRRAEHDM